MPTAAQNLQQKDLPMVIRSLHPKNQPTSSFLSKMNKCIEVYIWAIKEITWIWHIASVFWSKEFYQRKKLKKQKGDAKEKDKDLDAKLVHLCIKHICFGAKSYLTKHVGNH